MYEIIQRNKNKLYWCGKNSVHPFSVCNIAYILDKGRYVYELAQWCLNKIADRL